MNWIECRAKINLYLRVLGRRPDGYHELGTLFQEIDLADSLRWEPAPPPLALTVAGAELGEPHENLVWRAAEAFAEKTGIAAGGRFHLVKRIPAAAGLGGGSADAAATLRLLNDAHGQMLGQEELLALGCRLGADVPFFLEGGRRLGRGRGDRLETYAGRVPWDGGFLFIPPLSLATAAVFRAFSAGRASTEDDSRETRLGANDLLQAALALSPSFAEIWHKLAPLFEGEPFFMTGSGAALVWLTKSTRLTASQAERAQGLKVKTLPFRFSGAEGCVRTGSSLRK